MSRQDKYSTIPRNGEQKKNEQPEREVEVGPSGQGIGQRGGSSSEWDRMTGLMGGENRRGKWPFLQNR